MIVIPMAGLSSRFAAQGYTQPKYRLDLHGEPVFDYALARFADAFASESFLFITRQEAGVREFVEARLRALGVKRFRVVALEHPTRGQAETVALGLAAAASPGDEALCIFNIDTFAACPHLDLATTFPQAAGVLEVVHDQGSNWSFVAPEAEGSTRVVRTTEKVPISNLCCTGLYWFRRQDMFLRALELERLQPQSSELYVAPLYNHLIREGHTVEYVLVNRDDIILCGVPAEFEALQQLPESTDARLFHIRARLRAAAQARQAAAS